MALPVYTYDSIPTDAEFNAYLRPAFDKDEAEEEFPGHLHRLRDGALSNEAGQIKPRFVTFEEALQVTTATGLSVTYKGGVVTLPSGLKATIAPGTLAVPNNQTTIVYVNSAGVVAFALAAAVPIFRLELSSVTTVGGLITTVVDLRPRFQVLPRPNIIKTFGGTGEQGDYTLSGAATFSDGEYYFNNFNIANTATLTVAKAARIFVAGICTIAGSVIVTAASNGGGSFFGGGSVATGVVQGRLTGNGAGAGSAGSGGGSYSYIVSPLGSGGASGGIPASAGGNSDVGIAGAGGQGGGSLIIESAGQITITGSISAIGAAGSIYSVNTGTPNISGSGGGSGGLILLKSATGVIVSGTLDVRGGNGGAAIGTNQAGGGSGAGGQIVLISPANNTTSSTMLLAGGTPGTNSGTPNGGGGAGGGFGGVGGNGFAGTGAAGTLSLRNFTPVG